MATLGRTKEVENFLEHLLVQYYRNFELIIIDQNEENILEEIVNRYKTRINIKHIRTNKKGLSKARNIGLDFVTGEIVGFPDDDCMYPPDLLQGVFELFTKNPNKSGISVKVVNSINNKGIKNFDSKEQKLDKISILKKTCSISIFVKTKIAIEIKGFDEMLGVGAGTSLGSGEDTDFAIRVWKYDRQFFYHPHLYVLHPYPDISNHPNLQKVYSYAVGEGYLLKKHCFPFKYKIFYILRTSMMLLLSLVRIDSNKTKYYYVILRGKLKGLFYK